MKEEKIRKLKKRMDNVTNELRNVISDIQKENL